MVVGFERKRLTDCANCQEGHGSACDAVCPMRLKPRNVKRWMFACTQCGQCVSACGTVNRNNPDGQLLRWVSNDAARRNEAGFSALSNIDEDAGERPDMEEFIGKLWHNWVTKTADGHYPEAAVKLAEVEKTAGILFRAFGGDPGLRVAAATSDTHGARRRWLQRLAGSNEKVSLARRDSETLRLPLEISAFPEKSLNRDLYLWLAALAASDIASNQPWFIRNQRASQAALSNYPGLRPRYERLGRRPHCRTYRPQPAGLPMKPPRKMPYARRCGNRARSTACRH